LGRVVLAALRGYKILISPLFAGSCRFTPSCADYTAEAVRQHGAVAGVLLGLTRLARCRPLGAWGFDPVPPHAGRPASALPVRTAPARRVAGTSNQDIRRQGSDAGSRTSDNARWSRCAVEPSGAKVQ
jgi:hypothetical protein